MSYELRFIEQWVPSLKHGEGISERREVLQYRAITNPLELHEIWSEWEDVPHVKLEK